MLCNIMESFLSDFILRLRRLVLSPNAEGRENRYSLFGEIGYLQDGADGFKEGINPC